MITCKICFNFSTEKNLSLSSHLKTHNISFLAYFIQYENFIIPKCSCCIEDCKYIQGLLFYKTCGNFNCKKKNSIPKIKTLDINQIKVAIQNANSFVDVFNFLNIAYNTRGLKYLKDTSIKYSISIDHFYQNFDYTIKEIYETKEILIENSLYTGKLKKRLYKEKLLKEECSECKLGPVWNNKSITLQLDHINGVNNDNRLENLRILCPNCHSQTSTYNGRNTKIYIKKEKKEKIDPKLLRNVIWPEKEVLEKLVWEKPTEQIGKDFGVTGKAVEKWCKKYEIEKPPRGYWRKNQLKLRQKL